jgi:hypothetical protein
MSEAIDQGGAAPAASPDYSSALFPQHVAMLTASGISPEVAAARGYVSVDRKARLDKLGFSPAQRHVPGLLVPVHDVAGQVATFQYRPDLPRWRDGKQVKYETVRGARMVVDVPPAVRGWLADPAKPLIVTEGGQEG